MSSEEEYEMSYEEYKEKCKEIRLKNEMYLEEFEEDLLNAGLKGKTVSRHSGNVYFYINNYLLREEPLEMKSGTNSLI
jgi:hypothetical protein